MKLAEALVLRADVQKRLEQIRARLTQSALVQEGEQPPENPAELLSELEHMLVQLQDLMVQINKTNLQAALPDGMTLTDALAQRDILSLHHSIISSLADTAANRVERYGRSEIRKLATVEVAPLRRQIDQLARQRRELDTAIQATNWTVDVLE
ncbi:MAG: DIP1984 family protein [Ktedonobacteraceae bacterium]|nr:DIP1984 family protein [Ktedonobacteraceae bacterium]